MGTSTDPDDLNPRQRRFVESYIISLNASDAARAAGYAASSASVQGCRLIANAKVKGAIARRLEKVAKKVELTQERVLQELARVALSDLGQLYNDRGQLHAVQDMPEDARRSVLGIKVFEEFEGFGEDRVKVGEVREVKLASKVDALRLSMQHLGMLKDTVQLEHTLSYEQLVLLAKALREKRLKAGK